MVHGKAFLHDRGTRMDVKSLDNTLKVSSAGKRQVVGIASVDGSGGTRQSREPAVQPVDA